MPRFLEPCGTNAGYNRHVRAKEPTCTPCREAHAIYNAGMTAARTRALTRLSHEFPERFRLLYSEELEKRGMRAQKGVA